jgi:hypothetical protein
LRAKGKEKTTIKESGLWLREKGYQGSVIMGPKSLFRLAFYADGKFIEIPNSWEKVPDRIRKNQVKIVVVDSCSIDEDCPGFLGNWPQAGLSLLNGLPGKEENCPIHIYIVK